MRKRRKLDDFSQGKLIESLVWGIVIGVIALILKPLIWTTADTTNTTVTVANATPIFSVDPAESPASITTSTINVGSNVTFTATATDSNSDNYYLAICKTNSVTHNGTSAPSCGGGSWCISSSTVSGVQATCNYTLLQSDPETANWYAFACDAIVGGTCTTANQGTGNSGSPFYVNHRPTFTSVDDTAASPGGTVSFTTVASDSDVIDAADQVKLVVCSSSGATVSGCNTPANELCTSSMVNSDPSCNYSVPSVAPDGTFTYYSYIFDTHGLGASNNPFPTQSYVINNVSPSVSNVVINSASDIVLTESTTTNISVTATVTDNNSCQDLSSVQTSLYRSAITYSGCDSGGEANNNYCYANVSCSVVGGTCSGSTDGSANYTCTVSVQYFADPTDTTTQYPSENWLSTVKATDNNSATGNLESSSGVEVLSLLALSISANINYGALDVGEDTGSTNQTTGITASGNVGLDVEVSGTDLASGGDTIVVTSQKYATAAFTFSSGGSALTGTPTNVELNVQKTISAASPESENLYWGIEIPPATPPGTYTGQNYITALRGEVLEW